MEDDFQVSLPSFHRWKDCCSKELSDLFMPSELLSMSEIWTMITTIFAVWSPSWSIPSTNFYSTHETMLCFVHNILWIHTVISWSLSSFLFNLCRILSFVVHSHIYYLMVHNNCTKKVEQRVLPFVLKNNKLYSVSIKWISSRGTNWWVLS